MANPTPAADLAATALKNTSRSSPNDGRAALHKQAPAAEQSSTAKSSRPIEELVDRLFARFAQHWRHKWVAPLTGATKAESDRLCAEEAEHWAREIGHMTPQQMAVALKVCMAKVNDRGESWPPNTAEFVAAGGGHAESVPHWQMRRRYQRSLPPPPMTDERREQHRADLRRALRGEYPVDPDLVAGGGG